MMRRKPLNPRLGITVLLLSLALPSATWPCSIFCASDDQNVLVGNNEDFITAQDVETALWFEPAADGHYGYVLVGYSKMGGPRVFSQQGGMNEAGLFLDANSAPWLEARTNPDGERDLFVKGLFGDLLRHCATVDEALDRLADTNLAGIIEKAKLVIADADGEAAIYEGDWITRKAGDYLISTNFYESNPALGGYPCWRWDTLDQLMSSGLEVTEEYFTAAADAVHEGDSPDSLVTTYYTSIYDLKRGRLVLYHLFDYAHPLTFDLAEELALGGGEYQMTDLFGEPFASGRAEMELHLESYLPGMRLSVLVRDSGPNADPTQRDRLTVTLSGIREAEPLELTEIGPNRGVFVGAMDMGLGPVVPSDGVLQVAPWDSVTATYHDHDDGTGSAAFVRAATRVHSDIDEDGFDGSEHGGQDCDDDRPDVFPGAREFCDGEDDDCDGDIDEGCVGCLVPQEPDATAAGMLPNPLACGECVSGDFAETSFGDQGAYRTWLDVYSFDAQAGQKVLATVHRPAPDGVLQLLLFDESLQEPLADDQLFGVLEHTVDEAGTYLLVMLLSRVDHTVEPNDYQLELHCGTASGPGAHTRQPRSPGGRVRP